MTGSLTFLSFGRALFSQPIHGGSALSQQLLVTNRFQRRKIHMIDRDVWSVPMNDLLRIRRPLLLASTNEAGPSYCLLSACFSNRDNRYPSVK